MGLTVLGLEVTVLIAAFVKGIILRAGTDIEEVSVAGAVAVWRRRVKWA